MTFAIACTAISDSADLHRLGASRLAEAETETRIRQCHGAWIDTFNPAALRLYEKAGYRSFGSLDDFPKDRSRMFPQKGRCLRGSASSRTLWRQHMNACDFIAQT